MDARTFTDFLRKYSKCFNSANLLGAYLSDLFPMDRKWTRIIVDLYKKDVVSEIKASERLDKELFIRLRKKVMKDYSISEEDASTGITIWFLGYGVRILGKEAKGQDVALKKIDESDIMIIWGPPGTGKSYTMAKAAIRFTKKGKSVLILSHCNISVDGVIRNVVSQLFDESNILKLGKVMRYE